MRRARSALLALLLGLSAGGCAFGWGYNAAGQIGDGTTTHRWSPVLIGSAAGWSTVTAGYAHSCGVRSGTLWCWGDNGYGQLGDGTTGDHLTPAQAGTAANWDQVAAGWYHTLGIGS